MICQRAACELPANWGSCPRAAGLLLVICTAHTYRKTFRDRSLSLQRLAPIQKNNSGAAGDAQGPHLGVRNYNRLLLLVRVSQNASCSIRVMPFSRERRNDPKFLRASITDGGGRCFDRTLHLNFSRSLTQHKISWLVGSATTPRIVITAGADRHYGILQESQHPAVRCCTLLHAIASREAAQSSGCQLCDQPARTAPGCPCRRAGAGEPSRRAGTGPICASEPSRRRLRGIEQSSAPGAADQQRGSGGRPEWRIRAA